MQNPSPPGYVVLDLLLAAEAAFSVHKLSLFRWTGQARRIWRLQVIPSGRLAPMRRM